MEPLWEFLSDKSNRETLAWLGGGLVTVVSALWIAFTYFADNKDKASGSDKSKKANDSKASQGSTVKQTVDQGIASSGDTLIEGGVNIHNTSSSAPKWAYAMFGVGLILLGYAAFFMQGDCVVNGAQVGGDVSGSINVVGGSGDVECD